VEVKRKQTAAQMWQIEDEKCGKVAGIFAKVENMLDFVSGPLTPWKAAYRLRK
jgi:hypothetical protein